MTKKDCIHYQNSWCEFSKYVVSPISILDCENCNRYCSREDVNEEWLVKVRKKVKRRNNML